MTVLRELGAGLEYRALRRSGVYRGEGVADGGGLPVLLLPGFLTAESSVQIMGRWLSRMGYAPRRAGRRPNVRCGEEAVRSLERRLEVEHRRTGRRLALVGHSRGGHFARVLAVRRPDLVCGVVTLGAPPLDPGAINPVAAVPAIVLTLIGTAGAPGFMRYSCFRGRCCAVFREQLEGPVPAEVPHVAVHSRSDGIVDFDRVTEAHAQRLEIRASHLGMVVNPEAYEAVAAALGPLARH